MPGRDLTKTFEDWVPYNGSRKRVNPNMAEKIPLVEFDQKSKLWIKPFSAIINCMFPVEYVYGDWFWWQGVVEASHADPEALGSSSSTSVEVGSRIEGFCIPQFMLAQSDVDPFGEPIELKTHWQPDLDHMSIKEPFVENQFKVTIPIFNVEHAPDDPRYAKLRLTNEWKEDRPRYNSASFLHHTFLLPGGSHPLLNMESQRDNKPWTWELHGPVRKLQSGGFPSYEEDQTGAFRFPIAWPEPAMEWLIRARPSGWPSPELVQDILESGCHLAPVGRGKRFKEPLELLEYVKNPSTAANSEGSPDAECKSHDKNSVMDETEWRVSFSVAENKLGQSVSPVQRHVVVLLKMIKKVYFPEIICSYHLKNLLFWECENKDKSFWKEENSAHCLLVMLDRLQQCLEKGCLPHYILPQSNLLQYEDPAKLAEAAAVVADVRKMILPLTVSLLKRLWSFTYQSNMYLRDLKLEPCLSKIQDCILSEGQTAELLGSLYLMFIRKAKDILSSSERNQRQPDAKGIQELLLVPMYAYQSLLARTLCRLWFATNCSEGSNASSEEEFTSFVKQEINQHSLGEDFVNLALGFFGEMKNGGDPSSLIPYTSAVEKIRVVQRKLASESVQGAQAPTQEQFGWLKTSDFKNIEKKVTDILKGRVTDSLTMEDITKLVNNELAALFQERQCLEPQDTQGSCAGQPTDLLEQP